MERFWWWSSVYHLLLDGHPFEKSWVRIKIGQCIGIYISYCMLVSTSLSALRYSRCVNHVEIMKKIHLCLYFILVRLSQSQPSYSRFCPRSCRGIGTLMHIWWSCPMVVPLQTAVHGLFSEILSFQFKLSIKLGLLDINLTDFHTQMSC